MRPGRSIGRPLGLIKGAPFVKRDLGVFFEESTAGSWGRTGVGAVIVP